MKQQGKIHIVGIDLENAAGEIVIPQSALGNCAAIIGTDRFLKALPSGNSLIDNCERVAITPLQNALTVACDKQQNGKDAVVLASGDPLLYGIARKLIQLVGIENTTVYPAVSSIQLAFSRFGIPWDDAKFISLHGRTEINYLGKILSSDKSAILTDGSHRAEIIASNICSFLGADQTRFTLHVAENIGLEDERIFSGSPEEVRRESFGSLSVVIVVKNDCNTKNCHTTENNYPYSFGLREQDIEHSRGLITKHEVRAAALHLLQIPDNSIFWDVGAGSGSVGLEAARMHTDTLVYSIEKNQEQHQNILANREKFGLTNLQLIKGSAPVSLQGLPKPDRIFIGGSGGNLSDIITFCNEALTGQGLMVVTAVLDKTREMAPEIMHKCGLKVDMHTISVTRSSYPERVENSLNPITIIVGRKQARKE
ncbi:precorrin-6y C5,15-methyltransferase (decarboxylating) subunit CbiE [Desulfosediminicola sp.]|uniref:precorrin-6y C5,15-methyltransferase (decarboxylating) subunit CbiE n=1 Tax=Desulfosediminicola sp. TaxID=2886825 RepID=UPI003AF202D8